MRAPLGLLLAGALILASPAAHAAKKKTRGVPWRVSYSKALEQAKQGGNLLFLFFSDYGPVSKGVRYKILSDGRLADEFRGTFIPVRLRAKKYRSLVQSFGVDAFPAYRVVTVDGVDLAQKEGAKVSAEEIEAWLAQAASAYDALKKNEAELRADPKAYKAARELAARYWEYGTKHRSDAALEKVLWVHEAAKKDPGKKVRRFAALAHAELAARLMKARGFKQAWPHIKAYKDLDEKNRFERMPEMLLHEVEFLREQRKYDLIVAQLEKPARKFRKKPGGDLLVYHLGMSLYLSGHPKEARGVLREFVSDHPQSSMFSAGKKLLDQIELELNPPPPDPEEEKAERKAKQASNDGVYLEPDTADIY